MSVDICIAYRSRWKDKGAFSQHCCFHQLEKPKRKLSMMAVWAVNHHKWGPFLMRPVGLHSNQEGKRKERTGYRNYLLYFTFSDFPFTKIIWHWLDWLMKMLILNTVRTYCLVWSILLVQNLNQNTSCCCSMYWTGDLK